MAHKSSLCYAEAARAMQANRISRDEYIHHLYAHCGGERHPEDDARDGMDLDLLWLDPFAYSVCCTIQRMDGEKDSKPFEQVYKAYHAGDRAAVAARLKALGPYESNTRESLDLLALRDRNSAMLKLCMDGGMRYEFYFCRLAYDVSPHK